MHIWKLYDGVYNGSQLSTEGMVFISLNYRLGVLGKNNLKIRLSVAGDDG